MSNDIEELAIKCGAYKYLQPDYLGDDPAWRYIFKLSEIEAFVAALSQPQEAVAWIRTKNGEIDWSEDCLGKTEKDALYYAEGNEFSAIPLYPAPPNYEALLKENERLREALVRLRDCDWVISLPDRMDAVRDIAREALKKGE